MKYHRIMKGLDAAIMKYEDESRLLSEFREGPQHLYKLSKKKGILSKDKRIPLSTLHGYLKQLEKGGYLQPKRAKKRRRGRIDYSLTFKGFIRFLSKMEYSNNSRPSIEKLVENYGPHFRYQVKRFVPAPGEQTPQTLGDLLARKPPKEKDEDKPIFPLYYHAFLQEDLGQEAYFQSLILAARQVYSEIESYKATMTPMLEPELLTKLLFLSEKGIGRSFELAFLESAFHIFHSVKIHFHGPHSDIYKEAESLLNEEINKTSQTQKDMEGLKAVVLKHFDPNVEPEILEDQKQHQKEFAGPAKLVWVQAPKKMKISDFQTELRRKAKSGGLRNPHND